MQAFSGQGLGLEDPVHAPAQPRPAHGAGLGIRLAERGLVPDTLIRAGIRRLLKERLSEIGERDPALADLQAEQFAASLREAPLAPVPELANAQHYEVPAEFFAEVLGPYLKYSACLWSQGARTLGEAEAAALEATVQRAGIGPGQRILELGCGWGSLSLWMAVRFPSSRITAVSNSASQRAWIEAAARDRGVANLRVVTADMNRFDPQAVDPSIAQPIDGGRRFDRVVSVEMFEHMRNWPELFRRIGRWLAPGGRFFMHVFAHRSTPYLFVERDEGDWMSRHFFSGGMMPSDDLALRFQDDLRLVSRWRWDGTEYARTARAWLARLDERRDAVWPVLERTYGRGEAARWFQRWRLFFMACEELFGHERGRQWWVSHYLFEARA